MWSFINMSPSWQSFRDVVDVKRKEWAFQHVCVLLYATWTVPCNSVIGIPVAVVLFWRELEIKLEAEKPGQACGDSMWLFERKALIQSINWSLWRTADSDGTFPCHIWIIVCALDGSVCLCVRVCSWGTVLFIPELGQHVQKQTQLYTLWLQCS